MVRYLKHLSHAVIFCALLIAYPYHELTGHEYVGPSQCTPLDWFLFAIQLLPLMAIPQTVCNILGLVFYNTFPGEIKLNEAAPDESGQSPDIKANGSNGSTTVANQVKHSDAPKNRFAAFPHLCFRVVTRGLFTDLVDRNIRNNLATCVEAGLINFSIELVTDVYIKLTVLDDRVKQIVVPADYESSTKARFKARALQYALEDGVSTVKNEDFIVHLDEETLISRNVIYGILNFAINNKHAFGQGLINYTNIEIVNIFTTLADSYRVARDLGNIRFSLAALHRPIFGIKGSFVVTKCSAEKDVSFDHGPEGSIAEDCYFSMIAYKKGYTFDFIMGEMFEKSPFTMMDLIRQRKRWLQGTWLVVHSSKVPWSKKFLLAMSFYAWLTVPLTSLSLISFVTTVPYSHYLKFVNSVTFVSTVYMYLFGLVISFDLKPRSRGILTLYLFIQIVTMVIYFVAENFVVIWAVFTNKHNFYIVQK